MQMSERSDRLTAVKRAESKAKRKAALAVVACLVKAGSRVTYARVAREARVSTWLVYNAPEVSAAIRAAMEEQLQPEYEVGHREVNSSGLSLASVRTDLELARTEIRELRTERAALLAKVSRALGNEAREADRHVLVQRIHDAENLLRDNQQSLGQAEQIARDLRRQVDELHADLEASRRLNQTLIRQLNDFNGSAG